MKKRAVVLCETQNRYRRKSQRMFLRVLPTTALRIKHNHLWIKSLAASSSVFKATLGNLKHKKRSMYFSEAQMLRVRPLASEVLS